MLLDLVGQQPPRVAWVCVQLARSRRVECGRTAACSRLDWPRCNALRDGVVSALPDGARAQPQGSGAQASGCRSQKTRSALLLLQKAASWWLVAEPRARRPAPAADMNPASPLVASGARLLDPEGPPTSPLAPRHESSLVFSLTRPTSRPGTRGRGAPQWRRSSRRPRGSARRPGRIRGTAICMPALAGA